VKYKKKLIEVALPLEAINLASVREKSLRHGHPSTLHLWWARRPLAAARAVIFAQMVDDPSSCPDIFPTEEKQDQERKRLFNIIEDLVIWENSTNEEVLKKARFEIWQSWRRACADNVDHPKAKELFIKEILPAFHDPFAGGGAIPLEAQRLGLDSYATDLNPVAVLINKGMIEIPSRFSGKPPINHGSRNKPDLLEAGWKNAKGLAEDLRYYGEMVNTVCKDQIGNLYPKIMVTADMVEDRPDLAQYLDRELTVIAWLWARTVKSPNPAFSDIDVPLVSTFMLSTKAKKEAFIEPVIEKNGYRFIVKSGKPDNIDTISKGTKLARGANFRCLMSDSPISSDYIKSEGKAGRFGTRLTAIIALGDRGRVYLSPTPEHEKIAINAIPSWRPELSISGSSQYLGIKPYGMDRFDQLFTNRQLLSLVTFSDAVSKVVKLVEKDAIAAGVPNDPKSLSEGGKGARAYGEAIGLYLAFAVDRCADKWASLSIWNVVGEKVEHVFGMQALRMTWDFADCNPFSTSTGNWLSAVEWGAKFLDVSLATANGSAEQGDAQTQNVSTNKVISTDPPYYDNVPYADLSDFFYVWLRRALRDVFPRLFSTLAVPKVEELVAFSYRHEDSKRQAEKFFLDGMTEAMHRLSLLSHPAFPVTIYYAFKQSGNDGVGGTTNTGWETFLDAVIKAGFSITGTWPMRTERSGRMRDTGSNALASSIILVCRLRPLDAPVVTRREFLQSLKLELPKALIKLQAGNIAPVDLAQAAIGPGMAIYSRYSKVFDANAAPLSVRDALVLINQTLDEVLSEQEGDFDGESRWALAWFEQFGFEEADFGVADVLARAKATAVDYLEEKKLISSSRGKVKLLRPSEMHVNIDSIKLNASQWEIVHQLIYALETYGEKAASDIVLKVGEKADIARELCYRLYAVCERKKRTNDAMSYNGLVQSWPEIIRLSRETSPVLKSGTQDLFDRE